MSYSGPSQQKRFAPECDTETRRPPAELADRTQWVVWHLDGGTKPPLAPWSTGWSGDRWQHPSNWVTLDVARGWADDDRADGVGYVLNETPHTGLDFDDVRDPDTGDVHKGAVDLLREFDTYTELSPSETGFKAIATGEWPLESHEFELAEIASDPEWTGEKTPSLEVYDTRRYFTVTGRHVVGTPHEIRDRDDELARLADHLQDDDDTETETDSTATFRGDVADRLELAREHNGTLDGLCRWAETNGAGGRPTYPGDRSRTVCSLIYGLAYWFEKDDRTIRRVVDRLDPPRWTDESDWWKDTAMYAVDSQPESYDDTPPESRPSRELVIAVWLELGRDDANLSTADVADGVGYSRKQTRKALNRLEAGGYVRYDRDGRSGTWRQAETIDSDWLEGTFNSLETRDEYLAKRNLELFGRDRRAEKFELD